MRVIRWFSALLVLLAASIAIAWAFGAVWYDAPFGAGIRMAAALLATAFVVVLLFVRPFWRKLVVVVVLFAGVLTWWLTLSPTNDSDWQPDVAQECVGRHSRRRSNISQRTQLRLPDRDRLHPALGDADRAHLADHWHRPRD